MANDRTLAFGDQIKKIRKERGYSLRHLSYKSDVSFSMISQIERGAKSIPKPTTLKKLAKGLNVPVNEMFSWAGIENHESTISNENRPSTNDLALSIDNDEYTTYHGKQLSQDDKDVIKAILKKYDRK